MDIIQGGEVAIEVFFRSTAVVDETSGRNYTKPRFSNPKNIFLENRSPTTFFLGPWVQTCCRHKSLARKWNWNLKPLILRVITIKRSPMSIPNCNLHQLSQNLSYSSVCNCRPFCTNYCKQFHFASLHISFIHLHTIVCNHFSCFSGADSIA